MSVGGLVVAWLRAKLESNFKIMINVPRIVDGNNNNMNDTSDLPPSKYASILDGLKTIYRKKIKPVETQYHYDAFAGSPPLTDADIEAKPIILLLGQYSTGKTTFIRHLVGKDYPGCHIGPEPTVSLLVFVIFFRDA